MSAENEAAPSGAVRVSFARNDYIRVRYFRDEALTDALPEDGCRLDPGDTIYASEPELLNPSGSLYYFQRFLVREYDAAGRVKRVLAETADAPGPVFRIPEDFTETEISVIPLGGYRSRTVTLSALYRRGDQENVLENGAWEINGKRYGNGTVLLDPMGSYRVVYDYGAYKDGWYFAGSEPDSYWDRTSDGTITFLSVPSDAAHVDYKVWLHPYGSMTVGNGVSFLNPVDSILDGAAAIFGKRPRVMAAAAFLWRCATHPTARPAARCSARRTPGASRGTNRAAPWKRWPRPPMRCSRRADGLPWSFRPRERLK